VKTIQVKNIMFPIKEYATVDEEETLQEALIALEEAQKDLTKDRYKHRAVLVYGKNCDVMKTCSI
jgi:hypothetical protein